MALWGNRNDFEELHPHGLSPLPCRLHGNPGSTIEVMGLGWIRHGCQEAPQVLEMSSWQVEMSSQQEACCRRGDVELRCWILMAVVWLVHWKGQGGEAELSPLGLRRDHRYVWKFHIASVFHCPSCRAHVKVCIKREGEAMQETKANSPLGGTGKQRDTFSAARNRHWWKPVSLHASS